MSEWTTPRKDHHALRDTIMPTRRAHPETGEWYESNEAWEARVAAYQRDRDFVTRNEALGWVLVLSTETGLIHGYRTDIPIDDVPEVELPDECDEGCARLRDPLDIAEPEGFING